MPRYGVDGRILIRCVKGTPDSRPAFSRRPPRTNRVLDATLAATHRDTLAVRSIVFASDERIN